MKDICKTDWINILASHTVTWSVEDIERLLEDINVPPTAENINKVLTHPYFAKLSDALISTGNEYINDIVGDIFE